MGYMNPIERFGADNIAAAAAEAGVDGFLLVDCPPEESGNLQASLQARDIATIRLVAPTTTSTRHAIPAASRNAPGTASSDIGSSRRRQPALSMAGTPRGR